MTKSRESHANACQMYEYKSVHYPFHQDSAKEFFERVVSGEIKEPWKQTGWVNRSDYMD